LKKIGSCGDSLGVVCHESIDLARASRDISCAWQTFLTAHWGAIAPADCFTTEVWTWRGVVTYYTVFAIDLASRRVQILGSTPHPEGLFMAIASSPARR
jgi:hypothetical protein